MTAKLEEFGFYVSMGRTALDLGPTSASWIATLYLRPSFDPDLCITVLARGAAPSPGSVLASAKRFWSLELPPGQDTAWIASTDPVVAPISIVLDGMGFEIAARCTAGVVHREGHVLRDADVRALLQLVLPSLHDSVADVHARNALAAAGLYVDIHLDTIQVPASRPVAHVAVLGSPEDRAEVIRALSKKS